ncbi:hypothetical protein [Companilactobacillus ginsenosidimutans]|uniref:Uncharacterized protein n=1 Tax=Companilactobacillus ginsenosidimutans TaxID=1007676 RepID=A0A0H4QH11_9LACO|nr:hypothetical protein [Companilactobacillus ginsenosidimutans]AKP66306.1 hypothetical protein ABM34_01230 [Companilactobacillus ginsenosidimutans]
MNKVILNDFISEFKKGYDATTFNSLEVVNNDSLDQSSIFIKQNGGIHNEFKKIYSISPMNTNTVDGILSEASKKLPFDGYYIREKSSELDTNYVKF